jgi:predicted P-loop ATPase
MMATDAPWDGPQADNVVPFAAWKAQLRYKGGNASGELEPKAFINFRLNLTFHGAMFERVRLNRFTGEIEIGKTPWRDDARLRPLCDGDIVRAREWLQGLGMTPTKEEAHAALCEAAEAHGYDPLVNYLNGLLWDNVPRIDRWLVDLFGVRDTPYARTIGAKWLISAAARAFDPGCKADYMLVLEGAQDLGKSSALRALASPDWFTEFTADLRDHKRFVEQIMGKWIIEFAELASLGKSDMEMVKATITMQVDRIRLSYARTTGNFPRRCVLAATINPRAEGAYLTDETGNKRFWPVRCTAINMPQLVADRDQLWAEAAHRYRAGERWWLEGTEREAAVLQQAARVAVSPWEEWLSQPGRLDEQEFWTSVELLQKLGVPVKDQDQKHKNEVARIMTKLEWASEQKWLNGTNARRWRRKDY